MVVLYPDKRLSVGLVPMIEVVPAEEGQSLFRGVKGQPEQRAYQGSEPLGFAGQDTVHTGVGEAHKEDAAGVLADGTFFPQAGDARAC